MFNEYYCKDISRKVISARKASAKQGNFIGSSAPYGYWLDPNERHKLIIDGDAAVVVQRIFRMRADDCSYNQIADTLKMSYKTEIKSMALSMLSLRSGERLHH